MKKSVKEFYIVLIAFLALLASRVFLLNSSIDFFDSMQYVWRTNSTLLYDALSTGHAPHHPGYIFLTFWVNKIMLHFNFSDIPFAAALPSAIFGTLAVLFFYLLTKEIFGRKIAALSAILVAVTPYFWISNIAIIVDPTMICFYILSLYLFYIWLDKKNFLVLLLSGFALGYSMWAHTQIAFWFLGFIGLFIYKVPIKEWVKRAVQSLLMFVGIAFFIYLYLFVLVKTNHNPTYLTALKYLFGGNAGDHMALSVSPGINNYLIIMTVLGTLFSIFGFIKLYLDKKYKALIMLLIWLVPGLLLSALYLYANLYGRSSMICIFPGMIAVSYFLVSWQGINTSMKVVQYLLISLILGQLLYISVPIVNKYAKEPGAYQEIADKQTKLLPGGIYIASNLAKTTTNYNGESDVIWEMPQVKVSSDIKKALSNNKPVYIGQDAIMFPFYKYDGNNWEIESTGISKAKEQKTLASSLFSKYNSYLMATSTLGNKTAVYSLENDNKTLEDRLKMAVNNTANNQSLVVGKITDIYTGKPVSQDLINIYSNQPELTLSPERINYRDLIYYFKKNMDYRMNKTDQFRDPLLFTYTDRSGYFTATIPEKQSRDLSLVAKTFNLSTDDIFPGQNMPMQFSKAEDRNLVVVSEKQGETENINEIAKLVENKSYYIVLNKNNNKISYRIYYFDYKIDLSDKMPATNLVSYNNNITVDTSSEMKEVRYSQKGNKDLFIFGPWIYLKKGEYQVKYRTKFDNAENEDIATAYITYNNTEMLAKKNISFSDLKQGDYQDVILDFSVPQDLEGVEFKMEVTGDADIYLDYISLIQK